MPIKFLRDAGAWQGFDSTSREWSLFDRFDRANGPLGTALSGHGWSTVPVGGGVLTPVISNKMVPAPADSGQVNTATYFGADIGGPVQGMKARVSWTAGGDGGNATLVATPNDVSVAGIIARSVHISFVNAYVNVGVFIDGSLSNIASISYDTAPVKLDGAYYAYEIGWEIDGDAIIVLIPGGRTVLVKSPFFKQCTGNTAIFEQFHIGPTVCRPEFHEVSAR